MMSLSVLSKLFLGCSDELGRVEQRALDLLAESDPSKASETIEDYERVLALPSTGTTAERVARIVSKSVARLRCRPADLKTTLAAVLGLAAASIIVIERTNSQAVALGDQREIYRFFVYRNPALGGTWQITAAQALIDLIKPEHTLGYAIESNNFLCDDPYSLTDRDILGI